LLKREKTRKRKRREGNRRGRKRKRRERKRRKKKRTYGTRSSARDYWILLSNVNFIYLNN
jgi:hypothetical protein